jgi:hypothetical protein
MVHAHLRLKVLGQCLAIGSLMLLSACGGGGGGGGSAPQATPQSTTGNRAAIESLDSPAGTVAHKVRVVDLDTGTLARSYDIAGAAGYPSAEWLTLYQYTVDADGLGYTQGNASQLAIVQSGKVKLLDLTAATLGSERQLSSTADACSIERQAHPLDATGQHVWLRIVTQGPDHDCAASADNRAVLVSTDMGATDAAIDSGTAAGTSGGKTVVAGLSDTTGVAQGVLVIDRTVTELAVYSNDLKTRRYAVPVPAAHALAASDAARQLLASPTDPRQALVQVGSAVYLADWRGATLTLGDAVASGLLHPQASSAAPVVAQGSDRFYLGDGTRVLAIDSTTGQVVADATMEHPAFGDIAELAAVSNGLVVNQTLASAIPGQSRSTLTNVGIQVAPTLTVTQTHLAASSNDSDTQYHLQSVQNDTVYYSETDNTDTTNALQSLYSINAIGGLATIHPINNTFGLGIVDRVMNPHIRAGQDPVLQLLLCTPSKMAGDAPSVGCANSALSSYDTVSRQSLALGNLTEGAGLVASRLFGVHQIWSARQGLIQLVRYTAPTTYTSEIWLVDPSLKDSLKKVALP